MAHAAGGITKTKSLLDTIIDNLGLIGIACGTLALMFAGYKFLFIPGTGWRDVIPIIVGAVLLGAAGEIAELMLG